MVMVEMVLSTMVMGDGGDGVINEGNAVNDDDDAAVAAL